MPKRSKGYKEAAAKVEKQNLYEVPEAIAKVVETGRAKFDETVEVHIKLGVDGRHADQQVRGAIVLPNGTGKEVRVFATSGGSGIGKTAEKLDPYIKGSKVSSAKVVKSAEEV